MSPVAELPPPERHLIKELADCDADTLHEIMVALHALLADLAGVNGVDE